MVKVSLVAAFSLIRMRPYHEICLVKECGKASHGKQYCPKHISPGERRKLSSTLAALIKSACCNTKCTTGKVHEYGEQYCTRCKEPCMWRPA